MPRIIFPLCEKHLLIGISIDFIDNIQKPSREHINAELEIIEEFLFSLILLPRLKSS